MGVFLLLISPLLNRCSLLSFVIAFPTCPLVRAAVLWVTVGLSQFYTDLYTQMRRPFGSGVRKLRLTPWCHYSVGVEISDSIPPAQVLAHEFSAFCISGSPKCLRCSGTQLCFRIFSTSSCHFSIQSFKTHTYPGTPQTRT